MNTRNALSIFVASLTVFASARAGDPVLVKGRGQLDNSNHRKAHFEVDALKSRTGDLKADFDFGTTDPQNGNRLHIELVKPGDLTKKGIIGVLTGLARLTAETPTGPNVYRGRITVKFFDEAATTQDRIHHDHLALEFRDADTGRTLNYEGAVVEGNIVVR